ncbi:MAG TPA: hypothetical protein VEB42_01855 [Chitinophagaceae bacterium]|nr:hypothetical protein [Chitinophagaceae bacterium]
METMVSSSVTGLRINSVAFEWNETEVKMHKPLLYRIAMSLGFNDHQLHLLVEEVCCSFTRQRPRQKGDLPLRTLLIKRLVHRCVFIISSRLFQQVNRSTCEMPLCYRVVYELKTGIGLDEKELALVLNTSPLRIRKRLNRALALLEQRG